MSIQDDIAHTCGEGPSSSEPDPQDMPWPPFPTKPEDSGAELEPPEPRRKFFEDHGLTAPEGLFVKSEPIEEGSIKEWVYLAMGDSISRNTGYAAQSKRWRNLAQGLRFPLDGSTLGVTHQAASRNSKVKQYRPALEDFFRPHSMDWRPPPGFVVPPGLCLPPWHQIREEKIKKEDERAKKREEERRKELEAQRPPKGKRVDVRDLIRRTQEAKSRGKLLHPVNGSYDIPSKRQGNGPKAFPGKAGQGSMGKPQMQHSEGCSTMPSYPPPQPNRTPNTIPNAHVNRGGQMWGPNRAAGAWDQSSGKGYQGWHHHPNQKARGPPFPNQQGKQKGWEKNPWGHNGRKCNRGGANGGWGRNSWNKQNGGGDSWGTQPWRQSQAWGRNAAGANGWQRNTSRPANNEGRNTWEQSSRLGPRF